MSLLYPLILAKTRLQTQREDNEFDTPFPQTSGSVKPGHSKAQLPTSFVDVWKSAYHRDGYTGLYQGLEAQLVKGFLSQGVAMMTKQR